ncbi:hypothetical protein TRFO_01454 [Tritrichomonas foetus]|uniref:DUF6602 domain-containing protein n=1 Tax=Tritrichomonas foetus TaxID=1144522 RepID=A0A1J4JYL6_9EUKA|nr:hypothetical protein TRFO_01454 [Tritrichomonas foetus]|eukprot:OHT03786.1 hypothetical protein TRFO_01454 [Tritrichomonas foetus]
MSNTFARTRLLILGNDFSMLHLYWRYQSLDSERDILGFVYCNPGDPPIHLFKGMTKSPLVVYELDRLEEVIKDRRVNKCIMHMQNLSMDSAQSIINRVISTGRCAIEFLRPYALKINSFKPVLLIKSIGKQIGKTQLSRYFCSVLNGNKRKTAVIIPINDIPICDPKKIFYVEESQQYEFKENDPIPKNIFTKQIEWEIEQFQKSGAFKVYVTNNPRLSLIHAEQQADIIIYDSQMCEMPFIQAYSSFCLITKETIKNIREKTLWPGIANLHSSENIVLLSNDTDYKTKKDHYYCLFKGHQFFFAKTKFIPEDSSGMEVFNHSVLTVDEKSSVGASKKLAIENGAFELIDPSPFLVEGLETSNGSIVADLSTNDRSPSPENEIEADLTVQKIVNTINKSTADVVIISLQRDIEGIDPGKKIIYTTPEIQDHEDSLYNWLSRSFSNPKPPLQKHFEAQVDILMSMASASDKELFVTNNDSSNRESFCRLFLSSHLPPGFRVTTGEIIDCMSNITGQLDVVIVNDSCPRMTIDHTGSIIAPILADNVLSVIEVKTSLTSESLRKALSQLRPVKALMPTHGTLERPDGQVIEDPLGGKIITGIFAFNPHSDIEKNAPNILQLYPSVVDFVVLPDAFGYFSANTLRVCGIHVRDEDIMNGYVKYSARGIGLALIFGMLNCIAATRRFSGSNCVRYLSGSWGGQYEAATRFQQEAEKSLNKMNRIISISASREQRSEIYRRTSQLLNIVDEIRHQV